MRRVIAHVAAILTGLVLLAPWGLYELALMVP